MKVVELTWIDSGSNKDVWCGKNDYPNEAGLCKSVGYLIEKNENTYVIAQSDGDLQLGNIFVIPICCVKKKKIFN